MDAVKILKLAMPYVWRKPKLQKDFGKIMAEKISHYVAKPKTPSLFVQPIITPRSVQQTGLTPFGQFWREHYSLFGIKCDDKKFELLEKFCSRKGLKPKHIGSLSRYDTETLEFLYALPDEKLLPLKDFWMMQKLPYTPKIKGDILKQLADLKQEELNFIKKYVQFERHGLSVLSEEQLIVLAKNHPNEQMINKLLHSGMNGESILEASCIKELNVDFVLSEIRKAKKTLGKNYGNTYIFRNNYNPKHFSLAISDKSTGNISFRTFDENLQVIHSENMLLQGIKINGKTYTADMKSTLSQADKEIIEDALCKTDKYEIQLKRSSQKRGFSSVTTTEVPYSKNPEGIFRGKVLSEEVSFLGENGEKRIERMIPSDVDGVYKVVAENPDGSISILGNATIDAKTGIKKVVKEMQSLNGTKTNYTLTLQPNGGRNMHYVITDKDGKILLDRKLSHAFVNSDEAVSVIDGRFYTIKYSSDCIEVFDRGTSRITNIDIGEILGQCSSDERIKLMQTLKQMSAEDLLYVHDKVKNFAYDANTLKAFAQYGGDEAGLIQTSGNHFATTHELYHLIDRGQTLRCEGKPWDSYKFLGYNSEIKETYKRELDLFLSHFPEAQRQHIDYFINQHEVQHSIEETIAESGGILTTYNDMPLFSIRTEYLQRYFPETIAKIAAESQYKYPAVIPAIKKGKFNPKMILQTWKTKGKKELVV